MVSECWEMQKDPTGSPEQPALPTSPMILLCAVSDATTTGAVARRRGGRGRFPARLGKERREGRGGLVGRQGKSSSRGTHRGLTLALRAADAKDDPAEATLALRRARILRRRARREAPPWGGGGDRAERADGIVDALALAGAGTKK